MQVSEIRGPDSAVGIATRYGLDGPGIESRWGREIFRTCPDRPWGPSSPLHIGYRDITEGSDRTVALTTQPHLAPRLKKEHSYTSTRLWTFVACSRVNLPLPLPLSEINLFSFWSRIFRLRLLFLYLFLPPSHSPFTPIRSPHSVSLFAVFIPAQP